MHGSVHLICGDDEYRVSAEARKVIDALVPVSEQTLALEIVNGNADSAAAAIGAVEQAVEALMTGGLFSARKVIWLRDASFLSDTPVGRQADVKAKPEVLADRIRGGLPPEHTLVMTAPAADKRFSFYKVCKDRGAVHEFAVPANTKAGRRDAENWMAERLRAMGMRMPSDVQAVFLDRVGHESRRISAELEKLALLVGGERVARIEDVEEITSPSSEAMAWDLADAAGNRDLARALGVLNRLLSQRESAIGLIIGLQRRVEDLILYRACLDRGWLKPGRDRRQGSACEWGRLPARGERLLSEDLERDPRQVHPYRAAILATQAQKFSLSDLRRCRRAVVDAHEALVSGGVADSIVLEALLVRMLA